MWDALPDDARQQLTMALFDVMTDPIGATEPWLIDDGIHRILIRPLVEAALSVNTDEQVAHIYLIEHKPR